MIRLVALIALAAGLLKGKINRNENCSKSYAGSKKTPPGHKYKYYDHSSDEEHRTAEQYNWRRQNVVSCLTAIAAIIAVVFAFKTFTQARRQANIMQDQLNELRLEQRAWISLSFDFLSANLSRETPIIDLLWKVKNVGKSPAPEVTVWSPIPHIQAGQEQNGDPASLVKRYCQRVIGPLPLILLPGDDYEQRSPVLFTPAEINKAWNPSAEGGSFSVTVIECVAYKTTFDTSVRIMGAVIDFTKSTENTPLTHMVVGKYGD